MILDHQTHYGNWTLVSSCRENKPEDWKPNDPIPYAAHITAEAGGSDFAKFPPQRIPDQGERTFTGYVEAHDTLREEMRAHIDSLK